MPGWKDRLKQVVGGGEHEITRDDLLRGVAEQVLALSNFGAHGVEVFPVAVTVRVTVGQGSVEVVRDLVNTPEFEREVESRILNRLTRPERERLPLRRYVVAKGEMNAILVEEDRDAAVARLTVQGGDCDGHVLVLAASQREFRLGRGRWHGSDHRVPNDLVVSEEDRFVSRGAAIVRRAGSFLELEARDQGECLVVMRSDGARVRPARTSTGRLLLRPGDVIELNDGEDGVVRLKLEA